MHETHLLEKIFKFLEDKEVESRKKIKKVYFCISEFGSISKEHFLEHFRKESCGTKWQNIDIEIKKVPVGSELEITKIDFE
ncbi:MAG: hypothetical protein AB1755_06155 [Candidatus Omnitrophota bacterium]